MKGQHEEVVGAEVWDVPLNDDFTLRVFAPRNSVEVSLIYGLGRGMGFTPDAEQDPITVTRNQLLEFLGRVRSTLQESP